MSEVLRTFEPAPGVRRRRSARWGVYGRRRGWGTTVVVLLLVAGVFFWVTRDTTEMRTLLPAKVAYQVVLPRPFGTGGIVSPSPFWDVMPEKADLPERISRAFQDMNLPAWVVENLAGDLVHVSGEDLESFRDLVVITHMSRFGKLLELSHYLIPFIHADEAGGLRLRQVGESGVYYAVRGRLMIIATSRDTAACSSRDGKTP